MCQIYGVDEATLSVVLQQIGIDENDDNDERDLQRLRNDESDGTADIMELPEEEGIARAMRIT